MATRFVQRTIPAHLYRRCLSTSSSLQSGHSRWSKIKHDKGAADKKTASHFTSLSKEIATASRLYGPDPNTNSRLAYAIATAKKASYPKSGIETSIARGQGKSLTGASLENLTLEVIFPPSIGMVIDIETDGKLRMLADLRVIVRNFGGTVTPTSYLFTRKGRVQFEKDEKGLGVDDVLDEAIEAGAEDVESDEDGSIVLWTEPSTTNSAAQALSKSLSLKIESTDIIWDANEETKTTLESADTTRFKEFIAKLRETPGVQAVYANLSQGSTSDEEWEEVESQLD